MVRPSCESAQTAPQTDLMLDAQILEGRLSMPPRFVWLFSGHMIDAPDRQVPRFSASQEPVAARAIAAALAKIRRWSWRSCYLRWSLWRRDVATGREIRTFTGHPHAVATGREIRTFTGHSHAVTSVAFAPDGCTALSGSYDKTLKLWDPN